MTILSRPLATLPIALAAPALAFTPPGDGPERSVGQSSRRQGTSSGRHLRSSAAAPTEHESQADGGPGTAAALWAGVPLGLGLAAAGASGRAAKRTAHRPQQPRTVRCAKFGDWADGTVDLAVDLQVIKEELPGGIDFFRSSRPEGSNRYGEEFDLNVGSTDNVYVIKPEFAPWVMVGAVDDDVKDAFLNSMDDEFRGRLGHIVIQYFDGNQLNFVEELLSSRSADQPPLFVHAAMPTIIALKKSLPEDLLDKVRLTGIRGKRSSLEIEEGRVLRFVLAPTMKLPEALVAFDPLTGTLFSGKFFSGHRSMPEGTSPTDQPGMDGWGGYAEDWFHLCDCYFFTKTAQAAIRKIFMLAEGITGPDVQQLAPLHGPVVVHQCWKLMAKYEAWLEQKLRKDTIRDQEVLVMYASAYGHTKALASSIARGLASSGVKVVDMDLEHTSAKEVTAALASCNGFCIGSPTLGGEMPTQVKEALGVILSASNENKVPCGVFGSYGWSGEAVDELQFRLKDSGFPIAFDPIRAKFRPTNEVLDVCQAAGVRMSQKLKGRIRDKQRGRARNVASMSTTSDTGNMATEVFGKLRTSQCIMTSKSGEDEPDEVAAVSWVNQASFSPPGLTLALKKSAVEKLIESSVEDQLRALFDKYDVDGGGTLDREEFAELVKEIYAASNLEASQENIDAAMEAMDENGGDGDLSFEDLCQIATEGPLARPIEMERKRQAINAAAENKSLNFALSMVPEGVELADMVANATAHKKAKTKNGCMVVDGCHAFIECSATQVLDAGDYNIFYAEVKGGNVLQDKEKTQMNAVLQTSKLEELLGGSNAVPEVAAAALAPGASSWKAAAPAASFAGRTAPRRPSDRTTGSGGPRTALAARGGARGGEEVPLGMSEVTQWTGLTPGKEYRLQTMEIDSVAADTSTIRCLDWDRDRFDIEFALECGTTYNSYIVKGSEKTAIIDTSHEKFEQLYIDALNKQVDLASVDYLIVSHTEPDHSGLIAKVLELAKEAGNDKLVVVGSKVCIQFLEGLVFTPFERQIVSNNAKIDLGGGHELEFVIAPNLHWPDTMFTFDHATGVLFTCDAFGMHYCSENFEDEEGVKALLPHYSLYYDCLMKPNARSVLTALKKTKDFDIKIVATGHGPMLTQNTADFIDHYAKWSEKANEKLGPSSAIFWISNYGQSERLSQVFAHGLTSCSVNVEMHDLNAVDMHEVTEILARNESIAIMAPEQGSKAAETIGTIVASLKPKKHQVAVLDSYGGASQEPMKLFQQRFVEQEIPEGIPPMEVKGEFTAQTMQGFEEAGMILGRKMTAKTKMAAGKKQDKDLSKALGRLASSLYVVTAKKADVRHAMVASWVTPASTAPLGISLTIAKDRAMEPLLRIGDTFNINLLEEGKKETLQLMKHFLQRFEPGQDRLAGVDAFEGSNGAAVLRGAFAYLECRIVSRMDASDHWVGYAEVLGGNVARSDATLAVHHRKVGTYY